MNAANRIPLPLPVLFSPFLLLVLSAQFMRLFPETSLCLVGAFCDLTVTQRNSRPLKRRLKKLKRLQQVVSHRKKGGKNHQKAVRKLAKLHRCIRNQHHNTLHQVTTLLSQTKSVLVMEDLNVSGMLQNHHLAQAIGDVGFYEFKRQLLYEASWYGARVILADRVFHCERCSLVLDRDLNAAINLMKVAASSGAKGKPRVKPAVRKQEPNTAYGLSISREVLENGRPCVEQGV
jgi:IS605 OrfB family transposase